MARKEELIITLTDDFDGSKPIELSRSPSTLDVRIDLSKRNANAFEKALAPYVSAARKVKVQRGGRRGASRVGSSRTDLAAIREWAGRTDAR